MGTVAVAHTIGAGVSELYGDYRVSKGNIYFSDVLPTLCDLAGIEIPKTLYGKSFKSVLKGKAKTIRDVTYGVYSGGTKPGIRSLKKGKWKLIKYDVMNGQVRRTQLFNLFLGNSYVFLTILNRFQEPSSAYVGDMFGENRASLWEPLGCQVILDRFWIDVGSILDPYWMIF